MPPGQEVYPHLQNQRRYHTMGSLTYIKILVLMAIAQDLPRLQGSHNGPALFQLRSSEFNSGVIRLAQDRIIGGSEVEPHSLPFQASLQIRSVHYCSGSLINLSWILSAAHCVKPPYLITVVLGEHSLSKSDGTEMYYMVSKLILFPYYQPATFKHDIMLLKINKPVRQSAYISPVPIPTSTKRVPKDTICTVSGWGVTSVYSYSLSDVLIAVQVPIISNYVCNRPSSYNGRVNHYMICAGYQQGGKDSCQGDSGGPLICDGIIQGIVSWGISCAHRKYPGVYTNVAKYIKWIGNKIRF
ncbi:trypsin I-P1-like isoform X3 [Hypanus sabinus]|uniref:trypsin I-P1-like isoform X3 n=1 Tax=Hypanus sabinus TaxID=79690 RepID=UPI0028C4ECC7|nr:trypsin I-P1-like isoform X3 [Hypanus sabinus]